MNIIGGKLLPRFEGTILILHILGFFAILIPLTYMADHRPAKEVFNLFMDEGHWTLGLSFFIGLIGHVFAFAGGDAAVHVGKLFMTLSISAMIVNRLIIDGGRIEQCDNSRAYVTNDHSIG
jgi:hypothetical protein